MSSVNLLALSLSLSLSTPTMVLAAGGSSTRSSSASSASSITADVEALIAEAADLVALEQIAMLNSAHLADDDALLPADVESRFRRLKTFPASAEKGTATSSFAHHAPGKGHGDLAPPSATEYLPAAVPEELKPSESDQPLGKDLTFAAAKLCGADGSERNGRLPSPSLSPAAVSSSRSNSPSPPRGRACCFGFSPRKSDSKRKKWERHGGDLGFRTEDDYGLLPEPDTFSLGEQRRSMRRAMREEEKVVREAQKMVKWVKQASARMDVSAASVEELLSDLEDEGKNK